MSSEDELLPAPTETLAAFEPFVQWLLSAPPDDLTTLPDEIFSGFEAGREEEGDQSRMDDSSLGREERRPFENAYKARLVLVEAEVELEAAWDQLSCARREWGTLDEKLLVLQDERDDSRDHIALLERRIIKLLQDRDLAIAETYTTKKQIQDAEFFKARQQQRRQQQEEEQRKARVASALRKLLLRRGSDEGGNSGGNESPTATSAPKTTEKDVQRLHKELADSKVAAAVAKAERDERRHAMRRAERRCGELKLALAQARAEEDDLQVSLQQLTLARRSSVDHLQQISLFSASALPLQPPPAPTAGLRASTSTR
ncbi:FAM173 family [Phytophthora cinnamomi]|uniref:FAM173 family n=1 Tax=Phytophthora cinnamomi TaxID=4785 RepID=UPI00355A99A8|nr:FAM173 family [Phytophthora cinnamomi]